jgi:hypothetical protein
MPSKQIPNFSTNHLRPQNLHRLYLCRTHPFKHFAICTFSPKLVNHTEPRSTGSAHHHHRTKTKELMVFQGDYRKCFQEWPRSTSIVHHHDVFVKGPEYERKHDAELSRHCRKISSAHYRSGRLTLSSKREPLCPQATEPISRLQILPARHASCVRRRVYSSIH